MAGLPIAGGSLAFAPLTRPICLGILLADGLFWLLIMGGIALDFIGL